MGTEPASGAALENVPLHWRSTTLLGSEFELLQAGESVGEMHASGSRATAAWGECLGDEWHVCGAIDFSGRVRVGLTREAGSVPGMTFEGPSFRKGSLVSATGELFLWRLPSLGSGTHEVRDPTGVVLMELRTRVQRGWRKVTEVGLPGRDVPRTCLTQLILLSFFLRIQGEAMIRRPYRMLHGPDPFARLR